jgi:serine/threonine protein kinase
MPNKQEPRQWNATCYALQDISPRAALLCLERFIREARAVNQIGHPNIVDIFAFDRLPDDRPFLVMEYLQDETLKARLGRTPTLTCRESLRVVIDVASALAARTRRASCIAISMCAGGAAARSMRTSRA